MSERLRITLAGALGNMPFAGVAWQVLQYLEGFRRLGHEVFYLEDTACWPYDPVLDTVSDDCSAAVAYVARAMERIGLRDAWCYRDVVHERVHGASERRLAETLASSDVLVNLSGATLLRDEHLAVPRRIYLETDPVLPQIEVAQGRAFTIELLDAHTHHFSYGENLGAPDCGVPVERFDYRPTRPPIVLDWWRSAPLAELDGNPFTTIANWKQTGKDIEWQGELYSWSKDREFMRFLGLPERIERPIELALALEDPDAIGMLTDAGWHVVPAMPLSKDLDAYRDYIRASAGEFSVAKDQNVRLRSGWFSDRTASYLAAGRPAILQDTGFGRALPTGEGLLAFSTIEQAIDAFAAVEADYGRHCGAALALADEFLRAETVLGRLLEETAS